MALALTFNQTRFRLFTVENASRGGGTTISIANFAQGVLINGAAASPQAYEKLNQIRLQLEQLKLRLSH